MVFFFATSVLLFLNSAAQVLKRTLVYHLDCSVRVCTYKINYWWSSPRTRDTHTCCRAFNSAFNSMRGERSNRLCHHRATKHWEQGQLICIASQVIKSGKFILKNGSKSLGNWHSYSTQGPPCPSLKVLTINIMRWYTTFLK